ncbi:hypothetical protein K504DRAFT_122883 [Pleomassaria siparia CBS 279.74]|uniref:Uncharacterized protein n=1 Tax=Pleomassaria siparia CBS 279.74 TaxID=1314801 RepID=A0A6G1KJA9_9PLEO|nr:hypothetical protein K504DRAFT_122883 [Pleomassaria siparia CBS 279.74]
MDVWFIQWEDALKPERGGDCVGSLTPSHNLLGSLMCHFERWLWRDLDKAIECENTGQPAVNLISNAPTGKIDNATIPQAIESIANSGNSNESNLSTRDTPRAIEGITNSGNLTESTLSTREDNRIRVVLSPVRRNVGAVAKNDHPVDGFQDGAQLFKNVQAALQLNCPSTSGSCIPFRPGRNAQFYYKGMRKNPNDPRVWQWDDRMLMTVKVGHSYWGDNDAIRLLLIDTIASIVEQTALNDKNCVMQHKPDIPVCHIHQSLSGTCFKTCITLENSARLSSILTSSPNL